MTGEITFELFCAISWAEEMHVLFGTGDTRGERFRLQLHASSPVSGNWYFPLFLSIFSPNGFFSPFRSSSPHDSNKLGKREREKKRIHHVSSRSEKFANQTSSSKRKNLLKIGHQKKICIWHFCKQQRVVVEIHLPAS